MKSYKINEYIVTKVLGYKKVETIDTNCHNGDEYTHTDYIKDGVKIKGFIIDGMLPNYDTSLDLSFKLLELLRDNKYIYYYKIFSPVKSVDKSFEVFVRSRTEDNKEIVGGASSMELSKAICLSIIDLHKNKKRNKLIPKYVSRITK